MRTRHLSAALSLIALPMAAQAQSSTSADSVMRADTWAAEVVFGPSVGGASLIRFTSPQSALLFGAEFNVVSRKDESSTTGGNNSSDTFASVGARLGLRRYRQSSNERLRPVAGFGALGSYSTASNDSRAWSAGLFGELGAVYFVSSHLSLGASGELRATYGRQTQDLGLGGSLKVRSFSAGASLARLLVSVYF